MIEFQASLAFKQTRAHTMLVIDDRSMDAGAVSNRPLWLHAFRANVKFA